MNAEKQHWHEWNSHYLCLQDCCNLVKMTYNYVSQFLVILKLKNSVKLKLSVDYMRKLFMPVVVTTNRYIPKRMIELTLAANGFVYEPNLVGKSSWVF